MASGFRSFASRLGDGAKAAVVEVVPAVASVLTVDWTKRMSELDLRISAAEQRYQAIIAERDGVADAAVDDPQADKRWKVLDDQAAALHREINEKLIPARRRSQERVNAEGVMDAARREKIRLENLKGALAEFLNIACRIDQETARLGNLLEDFDACGASIRRLAASDVINVEFGIINAKVASIINERLGAAMTPFSFGRLPAFVDKRSLESLVPDPAHVIDFASRHVGSTGKPSSAPALAAAE
jgi:hypothetical protein